MSLVMRVYQAEELGRDGYPLLWHHGEDGPRSAGIKHLARTEARDRCIRCGHPYMVGEAGGEWSYCDNGCHHAGPIREATVNDDLVVEAQWRILTVHHLTGEKADCRWWNLAVLCQRCHLQIQGRVVMSQVFPLEHTTWFKPYAAGYYATTYLGEELSREQTMARLDELLALERVA